MRAEEIDEDRDGEIPRRRVSDLLAKAGRDPKTCSLQIEAFCRGIPRARGHEAFDRMESKGVCSSTGSDAEGAYGRRESNGEGRGGGSSRGKRRRKRKGRRKSNRKGRGDETSRGSGSELGVHGPSTACLAEVLVQFGFVFEGTGAATKPTIAEAFAMLRLHAQPAEARAAGEMAEK